ncbi:MAG: acetyltransferase [Selenomonadaceae bacterium]|nr:acetyltransferase [Selenomonadaceae bacterium]
MTYGCHKRHIPGLDFLKTLAILGVTFFHLMPDVLPGGYLGVSFFFVLTGYLLAYQADGSQHFGLISYYLKRGRRIYPSLFIVLLTTLGVFSLVAPETMGGVRQEVLSIVLGYNNWWQIKESADYFSRMAAASPFTHLWFLGVELQYYLVWPLIFAFFVALKELMGRRGATVFFALLSFATAALMPFLYTPAADVTRLYYGTDTRLYAFLFGAVMGFMENSREALQPNSLGKNVFLVLTAFCSLIPLGVAFLWLDGANPLVYQGGMLVITLVFCATLGAVAHLPAAQVLDKPLFSWLGKHSYGLFLWQYPVIFLFEHWGITGGVALATEIGIILALTLWSDALSAMLLRPRSFMGAGRAVFVKVAAVFVVTVFASFIMGYGCYGLAASSPDKDEAQTKLAAQLNREAAKLQNKEATSNAVPAKKDNAPDLRGITFIGDSVMLGAASEINRLFPEAKVNAEVSRYVNGGADELEKLVAEGSVGDTVVVHLGTNGPIAGSERYEVHSRRIFEMLGAKRKIFWLNTHAPHLKWQNTNNEFLQAAVKTHPNLTVIDWHSEAAKHPAWLTADGIHPTEEGIKAYAALIRDVIVKSGAE